jgi:aminopeptidase 2
MNCSLTRLSQYDAILNIYRTSKNSDEKNTALRSLGRAKDPELIKQTLSLPLGKEVKEQDIYLPVSALRTHPEGIKALYTWMTDNWEEIAKKLPAGLSMLGSMVTICTSSFTNMEDHARVEKFFSDKSTKGFAMGLAQSLESIQAKAAWLERDRDDVAGWVKANPYQPVVKSEL